MLRLQVLKRRVSPDCHECVIRFTGDRTDLAAYAVALWASSELMALLPGIMKVKVKPTPPPSMS